MNLSNLQHQHLSTSTITHLHSPLSPSPFLSIRFSPISSHQYKPSLKLLTLTTLPSRPISLLTPLRKFTCSSLSVNEAQFWRKEQDDDDDAESEDLSQEGPIYSKIHRLVECSMFAAVTGLTYFLSNSLQIENYLGCFFAFPIVLTSWRWGIAAGRKNMVATAVLLLVLSGPVKAITYVLMHGLLGLAMGTLWRLGTNWWLSVFLSALVRLVGSFGYLFLSSFLIREDILGLILATLHTYLTYGLTALGMNITPPLSAVFGVFLFLVMINCGFFAFLLHILYSVFISRLGMDVSVSLPGWLQKSMT
ncbi:uncharacterized protein LOC124917941 [Impatiens glandulifera]|uniref:uncharacterized protein LOC124917941 n=1 Tax=Impatiens glandulifera TaxID=253017 RepID=UPI001FB17DCF|nr:uncharacterized protein LOC124917941 [Impatiens glandulifera]